MNIPVTNHARWLVDPAGVAGDTLPLMMAASLSIFPLFVGHCLVQRAKGQLKMASTTVGSGGGSLRATGLAPGCRRRCAR